MLSENQLFNQNTYNYIIAGGGMAGLSLAFYLNQNPHFKDKTILIIDRDEKNTNDHTWCFWETEPSRFSNLASATWKIGRASCRERVSSPV